MLIASIALLAAGLFQDDHLPLKQGNVWKYAGPSEGEETRVDVPADELVKDVRAFNVKPLTLRLKDLCVKSDDKGVMVHRVGELDLYRPQPLLKLAAKRGEKWTLAPGDCGGCRTKGETYVFEMMGEERVKVPAGEFNAVRVRMTVSGADAYEDVWWAKKVGIVKVESVERGKRDGLIELKSFTPAK